MEFQHSRRFSSPICGINDHAKSIGHQNHLNPCARGDSLDIFEWEDLYAEEQSIVLDLDSWYITLE